MRCRSGRQAAHAERWRVRSFGARSSRLLEPEPGFRRRAWPPELLDVSGTMDVPGSDQAPAQPCPLQAPAFCARASWSTCGPSSSFADSINARQTMHEPAPPPQLIPAPLPPSGVPQPSGAGSGVDCCLHSSSLSPIFPMSSEKGRCGSVGHRLATPAHCLRSWRMPLTSALFVSSPPMATPQLRLPDCAPFCIEPPTALSSVLPSELLPSCPKCLRSSVNMVLVRLLLLALLPLLANSQAIPPQCNPAKFAAPTLVTFLGPARSVKVGEPPPPLAAPPPVLPWAVPRACASVPACSLQRLPWPHAADGALVPDARAAPHPPRAVPRVHGPPRLLPVQPAASRSTTTCLAMPRAPGRRSS